MKPVLSFVDGIVGLIEWRSLLRLAPCCQIHGLCSTQGMLSRIKKNQSEPFLASPTKTHSREDFCTVYISAIFPNPMKILLAAIAKNEAAYLPEWIFHHLRVGFSEVWIYVNRTDDNTRQLLSVISSEKSVRCVEADELLLKENYKTDKLLHPIFERGNPLQGRAFSDIYRKARKAGFDYVAYFDVDEYLWLSGGTHAVGELIRHAGYPSALKFKWFERGFEGRPFGLALGQILRGRKTNQCKYIISTTLNELRFVSTHQVEVLDKDSWQWIAGIAPLAMETNHRNLRGWTDEAYVIHRAYRSEDEFLALLYNGDAVAKRTFCGFKTARSLPPPCDHRLHFPKDGVIAYREGFQEFTRSLGIGTQLSIARRLVLQRAQAAKESYLQIPSRLKTLSSNFESLGLPGITVEFTRKHPEDHEA